MSAYDKENYSAKHLLAALKGETTASAPQSYISELFDEYSASFEESLTKKLHYDIPSQIHALLNTHFHDEMPSFKHLLDMGCGTGLAAKYFNKQALQLTGIDLSGSMLRVARAHNIYSEVFQSDIVEFLDKHEWTYDLFLATDVFVYIGALEQVFKAISKRAVAQACLLFSIELTNEVSFTLRPSGRYAQSEHYIELLARQNNWHIASRKKSGIRKDKGAWIDGMIFLLKKM